jgi:hypothetical protein
MINPIITTCQWIGNTPALEPSCCKKSVEGKSYCEDHVWIVYKQGSNLRKRKKDQRRAAAIWDVESAFNDAVAELINEGAIEI